VKKSDSKKPSRPCNQVSSFNRYLAHRPGNQDSKSVVKFLVVGQNKYQIQQQLGKGGFGVVWKAIDAKTNTVVAIKQQIQDPNSPKNWFLEEVKAHDAVSQHPCVPRVPKFIASSSQVLSLFPSLF
jgi:serine/threonine protein kinase